VRELRRGHAGKDAWNPTAYTPAEFARRFQEDGSFRARRSWVQVCARAVTSA